MKLIDWNNDIDEQNQGLKLAEEVENFNVFLQPCNSKYNKNVWDNCAKIVVKKTDYELAPYLNQLFGWIQDLNWPGAICVFERLKHYSKQALFDTEFDNALKCAHATKNTVWEENLITLKTTRSTGNAGSVSLC